MFISQNTTGFPADLTVFTDKDGRDWCVVVVKATYSVSAQGRVEVAQEQVGMVYSDDHFGEPDKTSAKYESDFAPHKPMVDVLINGHVYAPGGQPTKQCQAGIRVGAVSKTLRVTGRRHWTQRVRIAPSAPEPFQKVELRYENAYGGTDTSHPKPKHQGAEPSNPYGCGFRKSPTDAEALGSPVPQIEYASDPPLAFKKQARPASLGVIGRAWQPRIGFAGTYNAQWQEHRCPFLPPDFDMRYFQQAPADQQLRALPAGTMVQLAHLTPSGSFAFAIPEMNIPIVYRFEDKTEQPEMLLDTLLIEPDEHRFLLTWRSRVALGRRHEALQEVQVGEVEPLETPPEGV